MYYDRRHDSGKHQRGETTPHSAPVPGITVDFCENVTEEIGHRKKEHPGKEGDIADEWQMDGRYLSRPDEVCAQKYADVGTEDEVVVPVGSVRRHVSL